MTGWQVDNMWMAAAENEWERLHEEDPFEAKMIEAAGDMKIAIEYLTVAKNWVEEAANELEGSPMQDKLMSFVDELADIKVGLVTLMEKYEKGMRD